MFLDLHTHSVASDDSRAEVEQFATWTGVIRRKGFQIDGFVLTEHRQFVADKDYSNLARDNGITILKGSELDTDRGHFLVYGVTEELLSRVDFSEVGLDAANLVAEADACGAIAIPAHPGRFGIGLYEYAEQGFELDGIRVVERLNGSNRPGEQERADALIESRALMGTGGSDAHLVSAIGTCMTRFDNEISDETGLVRALISGGFNAVRLEDTKQA